MRLACAALLLFAAPGPAQEQVESARRLILDASRALQAGNAARFLGYFDKRATPQFARLRENVSALLQEKEVASSVQIEPAESPKGGTARFNVDWMLQLTPISDLGKAEERGQQIRVDIRVDDKLKIVLLEPVDFFRPATLVGPIPER